MSPPLPPSPPRPPPLPPRPPLSPGSEWVLTEHQLNAALSNIDVSRIVLAGGTYEIVAPIVVNRALIIEAEVPETAVLDAKGQGHRVMEVLAGAVATLIGLSMTGGSDSDGGGLYIANGGVANLDGCQVYGNVAKVCVLTFCSLLTFCSQGLCSSAPLERFVCSRSAGNWWRALRRGHGNAD